MKPLLYLLPNLLGELQTHSCCLPKSVDEAVKGLDALIVESEKEGRRFLRRFEFASKTFRDVPIHLLNEHSSDQEIKELARQIEAGGRWGLISDCGMPCLADPGSQLVLYVRQRGVAIQAFPGPSSILLALALSGLGGQRFTFHGYLPREEPILLQELRRIEHLSKKEASTHLFIEAPYRNQKLLTHLWSLEDSTWLCLAVDLTLPTEWVQTRQIKEWKQLPFPSIHKRPTVFSIKLF